MTAFPTYVHENFQHRGVGEFPVCFYLADSTERIGNRRAFYSRVYVCRHHFSVVDHVYRPFHDLRCHVPGREAGVAFDGDALYHPLHGSVGLISARRKEKDAYLGGTCLAVHCVGITAVMTAYSCDFLDLAAGGVARFCGCMMAAFIALRHMLFGIDKLMGRIKTKNG